MINNITKDRFHKEVWVSQKNFTGALAQILIEYWPAVIPPNLETCIKKFNAEIWKTYDFDSNGSLLLRLNETRAVVECILHGIPEIEILSDSDIYHESLDLTAVAQGIMCYFADKDDAQSWLELNRKNDE